MEQFSGFFSIPLQILCWFLACKSIPSNAFKDRHICYIVKDGQIPSFTFKRILYLQEYKQPVGDLVLPCITFRMLFFLNLKPVLFWYNPLPQNDDFCRPPPPKKRNFKNMKTLWWKEKMLVTSTFSFTPQWFLFFQKREREREREKKKASSSHNEIVICKCF